MPPARKKPAPAADSGGINTAARRATFEDLLRMKPKRETVELVLDDDSVVAVTLECIPGAAYNELLLQHRSDDATLDWDPRTFPPALVAACLVEPRMSIDEVTKLFASPAFSVAHSTALTLAALRVNNTLPRAGDTARPA